MLTPERIAAAGTEHANQSALFAWIATQAKWPLLNLAFSIPNGGLRNKATAARLKAEGVKAGVPDIFLPLARGQYHGLFIEMKVGRGRANTAQARMLVTLMEQSYCGRTCWGWEEARDTLNWYMELGPCKLI